jgi:penicillin amidase
MNRAQNYNQFVSAIMHYQCPAQNMIYADRSGNIAIWGQGQFINKWKDQGRYIMNGADSSTLWGADIPMHENPHALNPAQGYLASANETVTDSTYPYQYNGKFTEWRAWRINQMLRGLNKASVKDMFAVQQDTHSLLAEHTLPLMLNSVDIKKLNTQQKAYADSLSKWGRDMGAHQTMPTLYTLWWTAFKKELWQYLGDIPDKLYPLDETTAQLMEDCAKGIPSGLAAGKISFEEHLKNCTQNSFEMAVKTFDSLQAPDRLWYRYKNTAATHLAKLTPFSFDHLDIGGWGNTVNAAKNDHGPSWRMVVQMGNKIEAYGIYPGGQSGNPGSPNYADFLADWAAGKYYQLLFLPNSLTQQELGLTTTIKMQP